VTSAVRDPESGIVALGYVRTEVPVEAELLLDGRSVRQLDVEAVSAS
jgi:hypothetical protein